MVLITYTVQEMAMRLGIVAESSYNTLVKQKYGKFWMIYQLLSLVVEKFYHVDDRIYWYVCRFGYSWAAYVGSSTDRLSIGTGNCLISRICNQRKIAVGVGCLNIVFIVIACITKPDWNAIANSFITWAVPIGEQGNIIWYMIALVGNAIAPWMIFIKTVHISIRGLKKKIYEKEKWIL